MTDLVSYTPLPVDEIRVCPDASAFVRVLDAVAARWGDLPVAVQAARGDGLPDGVRCTRGVELAIMEDEGLIDEFGGRVVRLR